MDQYFVHSLNSPGKLRGMKRSQVEAPALTPVNLNMTGSREITTRKRGADKVSKFMENDVQTTSFDAASKPTTVDTRV